MDSSPDTAPSPGSRITGVVVWAVLLAIPAALIGGGAWLIHQRYAGVQVEVTVLACETSGSWRRYGSTVREDCAAEWREDGRTVIGGFVGGNGEPDVGRTVDATVRDGTAYSRSWVLPSILIGLGAPFLVPVVGGVRRAVTRDRGPA